MRFRSTLAVLALLLLAPMVAAQGAEARTLEQIEQELEAARAEQEQLDERMAASNARLEELASRIAELGEEQAVLDRELVDLEREVEELEALVGHRIRESFKFGSNLDPVSVFLGSEDPAGALARAQLVDRIVAADRARGETLLVARTEVDAAQARLDALADTVAVAREEQTDLGAQLQADYERSEQIVAELSDEARAERERLERIRLEEERRERERQAALERERAAVAAASGSSSGSGSSGGSSGASSSGGWACPLDQPRQFSDTWGAARSGGRSHRGTDMMGPHGIAVRAITSGTWSIQRVGASAGVWGILRGDNGEHYWYMHLTTHTVGNGARVRAGQQIATNGSTGNAHPSAPHLHFERHPGGGSAVNPYGLLRQVCG